jgi:hypothetical protein
MKETNPDPNNYEGEDVPLWEFYFYTINGQRLVTIDCNNANSKYQPNCWPVGENTYFGRRMLVSNGVHVLTDRWSRADVPREHDCSHSQVEPRDKDGNDLRLERGDRPRSRTARPKRAARLAVKAVAGYRANVPYAAGWILGRLAEGAAKFGIPHPKPAAVSTVRAHSGSRPSANPNPQPAPALNLLIWCRSTVVLPLDTPISTPSAIFPPVIYPRSKA